MQLPDAFLFCTLDVVPFILLLIACCCSREERAERADWVEESAPLVPDHAVLPYFPYVAQRSGSASEETPGCTICLEPLRHGALCIEVPACGHVFHRGCIETWARSSKTCPLCRAKIVPGSDGIAAAEDKV